MRLLSSGKSWVGLKDGGIRYQMSDPRAMPKFGSDKNRFRVAAKPPVVPPLPQVEEIRQAAQTDASAQEQKKTEAVEQAASAQGQAPVLRERIMQAVARCRELAEAGIAALRAKLSWLKRRRRNQPRTSAIAGFASGPVQGELSLDRIKVMRNDLSDADLEIVPAAVKGPEVAGEPALQSDGKTERAQTGFSRMTTELMGAGKT
jgi:hypothetical protein